MKNCGNKTKQKKTKRSWSKSYLKLIHLHQNCQHHCAKRAGTVGDSDHLDLRIHVCHNSNLTSMSPALYQNISFWAGVCQTLMECAKFKHIQHLVTFSDRQQLVLIQVHWAIYFKIICIYSISWICKKPFWIV